MLPSTSFAQPVSRQATLIEEVRRATDRFSDPAAATAAGYAPFLGCVSGPQDGAMGIHFVNGDLVADGKLDPLRPEALMYEPKSGRLRLVGVEYIVIADAWNAANKTPPSLLGQVFHYTPSPNRYGIPAFYALHVWAWRSNPHGVFADWNPKVSCEDHSAEAASPSCWWCSSCAGGSSRRSRASGRPSEARERDLSPARPPPCASRAEREATP